MTTGAGLGGTAAGTGRLRGREGGGGRVSDGAVEEDRGGCCCGLLVGESCFVEERKSANGEKRKTARRTTAGGRITLATGRDGHRCSEAAFTQKAALTLEYVHSTCTYM